MASTVARCHGTLTPPNASPTTRSRPRAPGRRWRGARPRPPRRCRRGSRPREAHVGRHDARVDLRHPARRARPGRVEVARKGQPAGAEVVDVQRRARREGGVRDGRHRLDVRRSRGASDPPGRRRSAGGCPARGPSRSGARGRSRTARQWYVVSTSQPLGVVAAPRPAIATTRASTTSPRPRRPATWITTDVTSRTMPRPTRIPLTGTREMSTKPVTTVPTMAPTVPIPDRWPTTAPVWWRLVSRSLITTGVTADRSAPGTRTDSMAAKSSSPGLPVAAAPRTSVGVRATAAPEIPSSGPSRPSAARRGRRSPPRPTCPPRSR